jgi:orotate phosphoribosyltransferase
MEMDMQPEEILDLFRESGALLNGHFRLTSGRHSDVYFEKFQILRQPQYVEKLCSLIAQVFSDKNIGLVVGPTTGGVIIAYEVARQLGIDAIYAEGGDDGRTRVFKRGFTIDPGSRVLIVDDILTTGRSIREVITLCESYRATIVALSVLLDRSGGKVKFDYPLHALATVEADSWDESECPLCAREVALTQRGSRKFSTG